MALRILFPLEVGLEAPKGMLPALESVLQVDGILDNMNLQGTNAVLGTMLSGMPVRNENEEYSGNVHYVDASLDFSEHVIPGMQSEEAADIAGATSDRIAWKSYIRHAAVLIWLIGAVLLAGYITATNIYTFARLKKHKVMCLQNKVDVYQTEGCNGLVGIIKPRIYVSAQVLQEKEKAKYVLQHEMKHYKAGDNYWLLLRTVCLILQWFNPLVWIAYHKSQEDCELACDYRVTRTFDEQEREDYAMTFLHVLRLDARKKAVLVTAAGNNKSIMRKRLENIFKGGRLKWAAGIGAFIVVLVIGGCTFISLREKEETTPQSVPEITETNDSQQSVPEKTEINDLQQNVPKEVMHADLDMDTYPEEIWVEECVEDSMKYHVVKVRTQAGEETEALFQVRNQELGDRVLLQTTPMNRVNNLIVSIMDRTSNYGSTDIHVLHMEKHEKGILLVEDMTLLDGYENSPVYDEYLNTVSWMDMPMISTQGEILTQEDGRSVLKVEALTTQGDVRRYIYWENDEWTYAEEYSYLAQWDVIARNKNMWLTYMDYANDVQKYSVTDLDENGRLEIIGAFPAGYHRPERGRVSGVSGCGRNATLYHG